MGALNRFWREHRSTIAFLVLMFGLRSAWADWVTVPTGSMNPTILEGDRVLVDKHAYGVRVPFTLIRLTTGEDPARGDIAVFDSPADGKSLVKRVIGVPGDVVELRGEQLIVNGKAAVYRQAGVDDLRGIRATTAAQDPFVIREDAGGPVHDIMLLPARLSQGRYGPITVPPGMYLVLGDNRDNSADSRYIGLVPRRNFVGRAQRVVVSFDPDRHGLPRPGRWWQPLT